MKKRLFHKLYVWKVFKLLVSRQKRNSQTLGKNVSYTVGHGEVSFLKLKAQYGSFENSFLVEVKSKRIIVIQKIFSLIKRSFTQQCMTNFEEVEFGGHRRG